MLDDRSWHEVAVFACINIQSSALDLRPWQEPPCIVDADDPDDRAPEARRLLLKMLAANISRYDPDPMAALSATKKRRANG
jgi:hypothetical protein